MMTVMVDFETVFGLSVLGSVCQGGREGKRRAE